MNYGKFWIVCTGTLCGKSLLTNENKQLKMRIVIIYCTKPLLFFPYFYLHYVYKRSYMAIECSLYSKHLYSRGTVRFILFGLKIKFFTVQNVYRLNLILYVAICCNLSVGIMSCAQTYYILSISIIVTWYNSKTKLLKLRILNH